MYDNGFKINLPPEGEKTPVTEASVTGEAPLNEDINFQFRNTYGIKSYEEYREKHNFKRACKAVGICFLLSFGIMMFVNIAIIAVNTVLASFSMGGIMDDPAIQQAFQIFFSILVFFLPFVIIPKCFSYRISDLVPLGKPKKGTFLPLFCFGVAFCSFANIATNYAAMFFESIGIDYNVDFGDNPKGIFGFLLTLISTVAVPSLVEEFALRGITQGILKKYGEGFAIISASIVFGLMHRNFQQMPFAFLVGIVLGYVTVKSGTLWVAVAIHAFNNGISVIMDYLGDIISVTSQNMIYTVFLVITLILGLVALTLAKNDGDFYKFTPSETFADDKKKLKGFILSAPIVIYAIICLLESCLYFFI